MTVAKAKKRLSRDDIVSAPDLPLIEHAVPEWGGVVFLRALTGTERDAFEVEVLGSAGPDRLKNARAKLVSRGLMDENGNRLFNESDIEALGKKNGKVLDSLFNVIKKESGLANEDIEELVKNFVGDLKDDSISS